MNTEESLETDIKYKGFTAQVDKSLKGFEYSTEWADLISALGRLIKVIQSNSRAGYVPRGFLVGKRLAQCLHPALPPGVHCKALECYDVIFRTVGPQRMLLDLPIYGAGLFSLLGPSAMAVKPPLFSVFEEHLLPLGTALQPAFMGLLQGLLPGLEQGAEFSERGVKIVEMFCAAVGPKFFYTCLWKVLIHSPPVRHFGISFILSHFNKRKPLEEQDYIYGLSRRVLVRSLSCLFGDSVLLVQRDALEFLLMALPIHFHSIPNVNVAEGPLSAEDCKVLCTSALCILLRRDASLNRRLFTWLKGGQPVEVTSYNAPSTAPSTHQILTLACSVLGRCKEVQEFIITHERAAGLDQYIHALYFNRYSKTILIDAVRQIIRHPTCLPLSNDLTDLWDSGPISTKRALTNIAIERGIAERPYRILTGLLDRCDLGVSIIEEILPDILRYTYTGYHALKQRSSAWMGNDSTKIICPHPSANFGFDATSTIADPDVSALIMDHILAKDSTKLLSLRVENQNKKPSLSSIAEVPANNIEFPDGAKPEDTGLKQPTQVFIPEQRADLGDYVRGSRLTASNEFLRTAHLFLSNLDGFFLWEFIGTQFTLLLVTSTVTEASLEQQTRSQFSLDDLCRVVHFLLSKLPIDTYPGVRDYHLPRLTSHLLCCVTKNMQAINAASGTPLSTTDFSSLLSVIDCLVCQMFEFVMSMFDQATVFSLKDPTCLDPTAETYSAPCEKKASLLSVDHNLTAVATVIGSFRKFFGTFCVHILDFSPRHLLHFTRIIRNKECPVMSVVDGDSTMERRNTLTSNHLSWLDIFTQMCRLLLRLSDFPLLVSAPACERSQRDSSGPNELMQLFCGDLIVTPTESSEDSLPEWFLCLLYASTEVDNFDFKSISLYTLFELLFASTSVHGWTERPGLDSTGTIDPRTTVPVSSVNGTTSENSKMRLILPVLSGRLLTYIVYQTNTFQRIGVSLWHYLSQSQSAYHEDVANLLLRLHHLAPPTSTSMPVNSAPGLPGGGIASSVEAFILSQMLSDDVRTQVDAQQRFELLWHLMRPAPISPFTATRSAASEKSKLAASSYSITAPCWRRLYIGSNESNNLNIGHQLHSCSHPSIPFYRCTLLLLDNLDIDIPWGPMGPIGTAGFSSARTCLLSAHTSGEFNEVGSSDAESTGLVRSVLRDQAVQWAVRALRTGQIDRLISPILAALLHPATVRISLKARVILDNQRLLEHKKNIESAQQKSKNTMDAALAVEEESSLDQPVDQSAQSDELPEDVFGSDYRTMDMLSVLQTKLRSLNSLRTNGGLRTGSADLQAIRQQSVVGDLAPTMLPLHEHLVIYLQNHDANQVVYALSRLRAILFLAPTLFVNSLLSCPVTGGSVSDTSGSPAVHLFGISLVELLARHRRALAGGNFYASTTQLELNQVIQAQPTLLDVIINLCILIMCSQLPCTSELLNSAKDLRSGVCGSRYEFTENEFRANKCAQKAASEVLELIVKELVNVSSMPGNCTYLLEPTSRLSSVRQRSKLEQHNNARTEEAVSGFRNPHTTGRVLTETIITRTCLTSAVLHCLAGAVEVAHWPSSVTHWLSSLSTVEASSLPMCFRLLLVNELSANLPDSFHTAYLSSLIRLTQAILELNPWSQGNLASQSGTETSHPNTIWPVGADPWSSIQPARSSSGRQHCSLASNVRPEQVLKIWLDAFAGLPTSLADEPLFRTACLSVHWNCAPILIRNVCCEQAALLLDVLTLALSPPRKLTGLINEQGLSSRRDLHPIWYQFVFATFASWGLYTRHLVRVTVEQICSNLSSLSSVCLLPDPDARNLNALYSEEHFALPPDYTLSSLACLQGIYYALLLPGGSATSAAWLRKASLHPHGTVAGPTASQLAGFPDSVARSAELAEILSEVSMSSASVTSGITGTTTRGSASIDQDASSAMRYDPFFPSPLTSCTSSQNVAVSFSLSSQNPTIEPSVILTPSAPENGPVSKTDVQNFAAIFTSRTKDLFSQGSSPNPDAHPLVQAQMELFRLLPSVITSLAALWEAFNRHPPGTSLVTGSPQPPDRPWPVTPTIPMARLSTFTAMGTPTSVRSAIWMFLEPIALHHPASFLITLALAWPPNLLRTRSDKAPGTNCGGILSLLTPSYMENEDMSEVLNKNPLPLLPEQINLLRLISGFESNEASLSLVLPSSIFINNLRDLIRQPLTNVALLAHSGQLGSIRDTFSSQNTTNNGSKVNRGTVKLKRAELRVQIQVNLLHIFYAWLVNDPRAITPNLLLTLLRDVISIPVDTSYLGLSGSMTGVSLPPVAIFILVKIFNIFLQLNGTTEDRREQRELQELCHRLLESTTAIAASALEQPSWFRRTLQVRQTDTRGPSTPIPPPATSENDLLTINSSSSSSTDGTGLCSSKSVTNLTATESDTLCRSTIEPGSESKKEAILNSSTAVFGEGVHSKVNGDLAIQAMELLAEHMASFLDFVYKSDEKDRISAFLTSILSSIFPYLRVRRLSNSDRFTAASKLLASLSSFQYTRRAWRREALDLLFEPSFFQMNAVALQSWNSIIDNLMTQDKSTFKESLVRLTFSQPGTLNLFSNKEAEHDLRAACLKKLSYLIYASEVDQYAKAMPDLLERLAECLRLGQGIVPQVHAQVFVFARILISRMSPIQLTSLWPIIIPELILVFKSLSRHIESNRIKLADKQRSRHSKVPVQPTSKEMSMYLSACKFLATGLLCSEEKAPQFSFYQWIFVNETGEYGQSKTKINGSSSEDSCFVPLITSVTESLRHIGSNEPHRQDRSIDLPLRPVDGCLHVLAIRQLTNFSQLSPFFYSLEGKPDSLHASTCAVESGLIVHLTFEASLAQEFPEPMGSR